MQRNKIRTFIIQLFGTIFGAFIMAIAVSQFLLPNELSSGGFSGIATITYYLFKIPMGTTILLLNVPLFIFAGFKIGKEFFIKSIIGTSSLSIFIDILDRLPELTDDKFLACIYGGILTGIGTAIILKSHSSTGGSDLLTNIIKKINPKIQMGKVIVLIDFIIVTLNVNAANQPPKQNLEEKDQALSASAGYETNNKGGEGNGNKSKHKKINRSDI